MSDTNDPHYTLPKVSGKTGAEVGSTQAVDCGDQLAHTWERWAQTPLTNSDTSAGPPTLVVM